MNNRPAAFVVDKLFMATALLMLIAAVFYGVLAAVYYIDPVTLKDKIGFLQLRPLHVTAVVFWILMASCGGVYYSYRDRVKNNYVKWLALGHYLIWIWVLAKITMAYYRAEFGGREYWEFPPVYALPISAGWLLFLISYLLVYAPMRQWKVYHWMWLTGICFFLFTFFENYLWIFPFINEDTVKDLTIQWKANGSLVGSWNQLVYGLAFFLMEKLSGDDKYSRSSMAFAMYFLGLFNLMFNWGHHIYTLPTLHYVRLISYAVSMTEWVILIRIIFLWKKSTDQSGFPEKKIAVNFLAASDKWILLNLFLALLMSIPVINIYTHGTHITVAHAMGTTIGINTMILFGASAEFLKGSCTQVNSYTTLKRLMTWLNISLGVFLLSLLAAGVLKGIWQMDSAHGSFQTMMQGLRPLFILFFCAGCAVMLTITGICVVILKNFIFCYSRKKVTDLRFNPALKQG